MPISPQDRDYLIRTVIGEAARQPDEGKSAVAHVIMNRARSGDYGGTTPYEVVLAPNQFEPWSTRSDELLAIPKNAPEYRNAAGIVDAVTSGTTPDPTGGATYFLNEDIVRQRRGGSLPKWAQGQPTRIGQHSFYSPGGSAPKQQEASMAPQTPQTLSDEQVAAMLGMKGAAKTYSDADVEALLMPVQPVAAPEDALGETAYAPSEAQAATNTKQLQAGFGKGLDDAVNTLAQAYGWSREKALGALSSAGVVDAETAQAAQREYATLNEGISAENKLFDEQYGDAGLANIGRVGGNVLATAPAMLTGAGVIGAGANALMKVPGMMRAGKTAYVAARNVAPTLTKTGLPLIQSGARGAGYGATGVGMTSAASDVPLGEQMKGGAIVGGAMGSGGRATMQAGRKMANKMFSGGGLDKETAQLASVARDKFGITPRVAQLSDSLFAKTFDSVLSRVPLSGYRGLDKAHQRAFNRAVSKTFGEDSDKVTYKVMERARERIGKEFDAFADSVTIKADARLGDDLKRIASDAAQALQEAEMRPLMNQMQQIAQKVTQGAGSIEGKVYQAFTRRNTPLDRLTQHRDPNIKYYATQIRTALDDAMERSASPAMKQRIARARAQWKAMKTIEPLAAESTVGDISAAKLMTKARKSYDAAYGNPSDLVQLGRIGQRFIKPPPTSMTPERTLIQNAIGAMGKGLALGGGAGGAYAAFFNPVPAAIVAGTVGAGMGTARLLSAPLRSKFIANRMINSGLRGRNQPPRAVNRLFDAADVAAPYLPAPAALSARN